ncbi:peptidase [Pararhodobacter sp. SW119]|uniref:peptidase n=1 Tax=Pararhodobacter sp. SW119 TaxID=2780075 RepID=UPI001ADF335B|nr:peptidase [Pararhodobacter sp. SW119]
MSVDRSEAVARLARDWLGTPYCHRAARKGIGCDCLGLVRGLWQDLHGAAIPPVPFYGAAWDEPDAGETLWRALARQLTELPPSATMRPGQILLFRMRARAAARHVGVLSSAGATPDFRFIHAYERHGVIESPLSLPWRRRVVARFEFH